MQIKSLHSIPKYRKLRVAAYARISNDKDVLETSLAEQIKNYTSLIIQNHNWEFAGIYPDDGKSGTSLAHRTEFMKMIENARLGLIDIILVKSISRFARNLIDLLEIVREFRNKGIEIYFEEQEVSSLDVKADQMITICAKFAEEEALTVSENVKWRYTKNMKEGKYSLPPNLYGYRTVDKKIIVIESEAKVVREIYDLCVKGYGTSLIIRHLENKGIKGPAGGHWGHNTICSILRNEKYVGDCLIQKTVTVKPCSRKSTKNRGQEDMMLVRNGHQAIVDREIWNAAQAELDARKIQFKVDDTENHINTSEFTGFFVCAHCHNNFTVKTNHYYGVNGKKQKKFLVCAKNRQFKSCPSENLPVDEVKEGMMLLVKKMKDNIPLLKELLLSGFGRDDEKDNRKEIDKINKEIDSFKERLEEYNGKFDDYSTAMAQQIMNKISELTVKRVGIENELLIVGSAEERTKDILKKLKAVPNVIKTFDDTNYRSLFARGLIKSKSEVLLILGNNDVSKLGTTVGGYLKVTVPVRIKLSEYRINFYVYVNR